jgi:DNA-binding transcriptional MerR regulator
MLKVGELARHAGVSVRTLHYYEQIGLLAPSSRTGGRHRLFGPRDIARLQQIRSLRQIGLPLDEVRAALSQPDFSLLRVLDLHATRLREQMERLRELLGRLERVARHVARSKDVPVDDILHALQGIALAEQYFTPEQRDTIARRGRRLGAARIARAQRDWVTLMDEVRRAMARADDPASASVRRLARRWRALVCGFTGGDAGIARSLRTRFEREPVIHGVETLEWRRMCDYLAPAASELDASAPARGATSRSRQARTSRRPSPNRP